MFMLLLNDAQADILPGDVGAPIHANSAPEMESRHILAASALFQVRLLPF
jgi:hypothetical protein